MATVDMTKQHEEPQHDERGLDIPPGLPHGFELGRIANREQALAIFGRDFTMKLTDHAMRGDEIGYRALLDFADRGVNSNWRLFDQALEHGIDSIDDPAPSLVALFEDMEREPDWVDHDQLYRAACTYWRAGKLVPMAMSWSAIGAGFSMYSSTRPVLFSKRLSDPEAAGPRLNESFRQISAAYTPGGMRRFEKGWKLTAKARMIHAVVRKTLSKHPDWDWSAWGVPINNLDCMNTQAGQFSVVIVDTLRRSGIKITDQEEEDMFALTRYVGHVIGVPHDLLHTGVADARRKRRFHQLIEQPPDDACRDTIHSIIDFSTKIPEGGYDPLPGPVAKFMTHDRRKALAYGMLTSWQPEYVEGLHVQPTPWRHLLPAVKPAIWAVDRIARRLPHDDEKATWKVIDEFERAIGLPPEQRHQELADPKTLEADIRANKGGAKKTRFAETGQL